MSEGFIPTSDDPDKVSTGDESDKVSAVSAQSADQDTQSLNPDTPSLDQHTQSAGQHTQSVIQHEGRNNRKFFIGLALVVAVVVATRSIGGALVVAAIIGMIMVHELGHFMAAKWSGMQVTEYFLGFGPKLWSFKKGETEYGVKAIPAGAYVRITGMSNLEEVDPEVENRTYRQKSYWRRMAVAVAGSFMHFVMAFFLLYAINVGTGVPTFNPADTRVGKVSEAANGLTPAQQAGFKEGDKIISVDDHVVNNWKEVTDYIPAHAGSELKFVVERNGSQIELKTTPVARDTILLKGETTPVDAKTGFIGIGASHQNVRVNPWVGLGRSAKQLQEASVLVVKNIVHVFSATGISSYWNQLTSTSPLGTDNDQSTASQASTAANEAANDERFVSPLGLVNFANQAADSGLRTVLVFLFSINVFIGIFNMIPLLPFDGGHVAVATYEKLRSLRGGKRHMVDFAKLVPFSYAVVMILAFIGLSSLWLDIFNPVTNPFQ